MFINKESSIEHLLQNNHKNGSRLKEFNKNADTSSTSLPKATISGHPPKLNSVRFDGQYDHINPTENTQNDTHCIDAYE